MLQHATVAGKAFRLRTEAKKDVLAAAHAAGVVANELRLAEFALGELPVAGFSLLCEVVLHDAATTSLELSKNALTPEHAAALGDALTRPGVSVARLGLERNGGAFGSEGAVRLCAALLQRQSSVTEPDLGFHAASHLTILPACPPPSLR